MTASVLVACPTYAGKAYALDAWIAAYQALDYETCGALMVDNTKGSDAYMQELAARGVPAIHIEPAETWGETFWRSWCVIYEYARRVGAKYVLSLEADVIVGPEALATMVNYLEKADVPLMFCLYPLRQSVADHMGWGPAAHYTNSMGCTLIETNYLEACLATAYWATRKPSGRYGGRSLEDVIGEPADSGMAVYGYGLFDVQHLDDTTGSDTWRFGPDERLLFAYPTVGMPAGREITLVGDDRWVVERAPRAETLRTGAPRNVLTQEAAR